MRVERFTRYGLQSVTTIDPDTATVTVEVDGKVIERRDATADELAAATWTPEPTADDVIAELRAEVDALRSAVLTRTTITAADLTVAREPSRTR